MKPPMHARAVCEVAAAHPVLLPGPRNESARTRGRNRVLADTRLEDVCGNRVGQPFEVDIFRPITRKIETKTYERPFSVR